MKFNPRVVPWLSILGALGLGIGYLVGQGSQAEPMIPAYWGLCGGISAGLILRLVLTRRWTQQLKNQKDSSGEGPNP